MRIVNRSLLVGCLALGALALLGVVYGRLTEAAPVPSVTPLTTRSHAAASAVESADRQTANEQTPIHDTHGLAQSSRL